MDWSIDSGNSQTFCGSGQAIDFQQPQSWVSYLTPGTWTTQVEAYSEGANQELYRTANLYATRKYLAHASYTDTFGGAVAGPGSDFPAIASADFGYGPSLFDPPVTRGGTICCSRTAVTLRIGRHVVRKQTFSIVLPVVLRGDHPPGRLVHAQRDSAALVPRRQHAGQSALAAGGGELPVPCLASAGRQRKLAEFASHRYLVPAPRAEHGQRCARWRNDPPGHPR